LAQMQLFTLRRWIGIFVGLVVLAMAALGVRELSGKVPPQNTAETAVPVMAAVAIRHDVPDFVNTIGTVQSIDSVAIQSQVYGPIVKVEFEPGQEVKKGQELFLIDPRPYQAAVDQAQAQLDHDQATLGEAQMDLKRYQLLQRENSIARQQAQDQQYVVEQDQGTVEVDEANLESARINLGYSHITAPITGRAGILLVELGNLVGSQAQTSSRSTGSQSTAGTEGAATSAPATTAGQTGASSGLVTITQMQPIYVSFPVSETMLAGVRKNQAAGALTVEAYSQSGKLLEKGKLTVIDNQVNASTGTVMMQGTFGNTNEVLWPGAFVSVRLIVSIRHDAVTVPEQAVMTGPSGSYVYVIGTDQTVHRAAVQVAARQDKIAVIEKGISAGEEVVTDGQYRLANGVKVEVQQTTEASVAQQ
jgi:membrane fusion protein, multidrug efflux system